MNNMSTVYVIGSFVEGSSGGFNWYRNPFDAGRAFEQERIAAPEESVVYHDTVMVTETFGSEYITRYIDAMLPELEETAKSRGFTPKVAE